MKSTGIVRKVDELGRIVLPIELRRNLGIEEKDALEIYVEGASVIFGTCSVLDHREDIPYNGKKITHEGGRMP